MYVCVKFQTWEIPLRTASITLRACENPQGVAEISFRPMLHSPHMSPTTFVNSAEMLSKGCEMKMSPTTVKIYSWQHWNGCEMKYLKGRRSILCFDLCTILIPGGPLIVHSITRPRQKFLLLLRFHIFWWSWKWWTRLPYISLYKSRTFPAQFGLPIITGRRTELEVGILRVVG